MRLDPIGLDGMRLDRIGWMNGMGFIGIGLDWIGLDEMSLDGIGL